MMKEKVKSIIEIDYKKHHHKSVGDQMRQIAAPLEKYGISYFGFGRVNKYREETFLTSNTDSSQIYTQGKFYENLFCDDINKYCDANLLWSDIAESCSYAGKMFSQFSESANIAHGLSMVRTYHSYVDHYYFATERSNHKINIFYLNNLDLFESFINYFRDVAAGLIVEAERQRLYIPDCLDDSILTHTDMLLRPANQFNHSYNHLLNFYGLTKREIQCFNSLTAGMGCKKIANDLQLSPRTVEKHILKIKQKTNSKTLYQAIAKLLGVKNDGLKTS